MLVALSFAIILTNWVKKQNIKKNIINQIPGPTGKPIIGILLDFLCPPEEIWNYFRKSSIKYYPIYKYWFGPCPVINLLCPEDIEILLSTTKHSTKSQIYDVLHPWLGTGLLTSEGRKWQSRRKILTPAFHINVLRQFIEVFGEESKLLVQELEKECNKLSTDVVPVITQSTLHSICEKW